MFHEEWVCVLEEVVGSLFKRYPCESVEIVPVVFLQFRRECLVSVEGQLSHLNGYGQRCSQGERQGSRRYFAVEGIVEPTKVVLPARVEIPVSCYLWSDVQSSDSESKLVSTGQSCNVVRQLHSLSDCYSPLTEVSGWFIVLHEGLEIVREVGPPALREGCDQPGHESCLSQLCYLVRSSRRGCCRKR